MKPPLDDEKRRRIVHSLRIVPDTIIFHNYELGKIYKVSVMTLSFPDRDVTQSTKERRQSVNSTNEPYQFLNYHCNIGMESVNHFV